MTPRAHPVVLALLACAVVGLAGCDSLRSTFMRGGSGSASEAGSSDRGQSLASNADRTTDDPIPERGEREVEFPVVAQSVADSLFPGGGDEKFAQASVPVLAPASMSTEQAEAFTNSFRTTPDGYFARIAADEFDVIVNGTRAYAVAPEAAGAQTRDTSVFQFSESVTGLSVAFNRFGADYSIDFVCRGAGDEGDGDCVTEARAAEFVERLVPVGGGGR